MNYSINRVANLVVGSSLIITTMAANTIPLGALAILPLIGAALILVGIYDESPLPSARSNIVNKAKKLVSNASHGRPQAA